MDSTGIFVEILVMRKVEQKPRSIMADSGKIGCQLTGSAKKNKFILHFKRKQKVAWALFQEQENKRNQI